VASGSTSSQPRSGSANIAPRVAISGSRSASTSANTTRKGDEGGGGGDGGGSCGSAGGRLAEAPFGPSPASHWTPNFSHLLASPYPRPLDVDDATSRPVTPSFVISADISSYFYLQMLWVAVFFAAN
jgi:hypothetical protein